MRLAEAQQTTDTPDSFLVVLSGRIRRFALSLLSQLLADDVLATYRGAADGLAPLDSNSKVPAANLPSYVDDVLEYANYAALPGTGVSGVLYITTSDGKSWRWTGSTYAEIAAAPDFASQAEAEAGVNTTKSMSPLRVKQAIDALSPAGSTVTEPGIIYVDGTNGNNANAGTASAPKQTLDAALTAAAALSPAKVVIYLRKGNYSSSYCTTLPFPGNVTLSGDGVSLSQAVLSVAVSGSIRCIPWTVNLSVSGYGVAGDVGGGNGGDGPSLTLINCCGDYAISTGGSGGEGSVGPDGDAGHPDGYDGGNGGNGGNGGSLELHNCCYITVATGGGSPGVGGAGGNPDVANGGTSSGNAGSDGSSGYPGSGYLYRSIVDNMTCGDFTWGGSMVNSVSFNFMATNYGGNTSSGVPFPAYFS